MNKVVLLFALLLFSFSGCCAQDFSQRQNVSGERPKEVLEPYTWDFGQVEEGEVLEHIFTLKNESLKTLNIKNINTSCGCTASEAKKNSLELGESTNIEVKFNTKGYHGETKQFIYVNTDDIDNPVIKFTIKAEVVKQPIDSP